MADTLALMILKVSECLRGLRYSKSTSSSVTSLVDSMMIDEPDHFFKGGTIFFLSGALIGKTAVITEFASATGTFTFDTQTVSPGMGIIYAVSQAMFSRETIAAVINKALVSIGPFPRIYENASFITVADQEFYVLPIGVSNIKKVFIASNSSAPYNWQENTGWFEENGSLYFDMEQPSIAGMMIRLYYELPHTSLVNDTDAIIDSIHPDLVMWTAAHYATLIRSGVSENSEPFTKEMVTFTQQKMQECSKYLPKHWQKASRPSGW